jgi:hypothetical protein
MDRWPEPEVVAREDEGLLRLLTRKIEFTAMHRDQSDRKVVRRLLEPVLGLDFSGAGGV